MLTACVCVLALVMDKHRTMIRQQLTPKREMSKI
jgi:hypothetical protein